MGSVRRLGIVLGIVVLIVSAASGILAARYTAHAGTSSASALTMMPARINLVIVPDALHGPDKHTHDAFVPAFITAIAGQRVEVTVYNLDTAPHSFTAPSLGLNVIVAGAKSEGVPSITTFSFTSNKIGTFHWKCILPCDNGGVNAWAMTHDGYMAGTVTIQKG